jgi:hypothetical protein
MLVMVRKQGSQRKQRDTFNGGWSIEGLRRRRLHFEGEDKRKDDGI